MKRRLTVIASLICIVGVPTLRPLLVFTLLATMVAHATPSFAEQTGSESHHPQEYWRSIVQHDYAPPAGASVTGLATELSVLLGSADPELRDEFGYSILTAWIYEKRLLQPDAVRPLMRQWVANLKAGIGSTEGTSVLRRSFSALMLSVVVARDNAAPFLEKTEVRQLLDAALEYLDGEKDLRGYDARTGWLHSAAHTADLLKFLGRSRYLERSDQSQVLEAVTRKLRESSVVFTFGEDERFARAVLSVINRSDFDDRAFHSWVVQSRPAALTSRTPDPADLRASQNLKNLFSKLAVVLSMVAESTPGIQGARADVRLALDGLF